MPCGSQNARLEELQSQGAAARDALSSIVAQQLVASEGASSLAAEIAVLTQDEEEAARVANEFMDGHGEFEATQRANRDRCAAVSTAHALAHA